MGAPNPKPDEMPRFDLYGDISIDLVLRKLKEAREQHLKEWPASNTADQ